MASSTVAPTSPSLVVASSEKSLQPLACRRKTCISPRTYDQKPFQVDGCMDLDLTFSDKTMCTPINIKRNAHDQLLLSLQATGHS